MATPRIRRTAIVLASVLVCVGLLDQTTVFPPSSPRVHLPLAVKQEMQGVSDHLVNAPRLTDETSWKQLAIFWFGRITSTSNYADVRVGYTDQELYLHLLAFDRYLWYNTSPSPLDLESWDTATLYLDLGGNISSTPSNKAYRFVAMLNWWERDRSAFQTAYRGDGAKWISATIPFTTETGWRGNAPNDNFNDRGWTVTFRIPFTSLSLSRPPPPATVWGMALSLHDRDDAAGTPVPAQNWPGAMGPSQPATWGQLAFGLPVYPSLASKAQEIISIRRGLNAIAVPDADVGGTVATGTCAWWEDDTWIYWGETNYGHSHQVNVQNQGDVADWACFAKYYVTFPLDAVPPGKVIVSATLIMHQFGNADWSAAQPSWIQVLTTDGAWEEDTITWNNAPLVAENIGGAWVEPVTAQPPWPGIARTWDVSRAVAHAYAAGQPVRLVLYSADWDYHSGKYFVSSDADDWNAAGRPTLQVVWGDP